MSASLLRGVLEQLLEELDEVVLRRGCVVEEEQERPGCHDYPPSHAELSAVRARGQSSEPPDHPRGAFVPHRTNHHLGRSGERGKSDGNVSVNA